ncbi:hypothetical protein HMPREF3071_13075 [Clostridium sp. HMSC19A11]|nr:hypothetical protein HMPREF3071_13075 [Clostridium sp. HMSC19A11]
MNFPENRPEMQHKNLLSVHRRLLPPAWADFSLRRHYAENVKEVEERACFLLKRAWTQELQRALPEMPA